MKENINQKKIEEIHNKLVLVAKNKSLITYFDLNKCFDSRNKNFLNPFLPLFEHLNHLNINLCETKKPLLTSLVINKKTGRPGKGFFYVAKELELFKGDPENSGERLDFWYREKNRVYNFSW
ncbi:MAG: hypothetical protein ACQESP_05340 [Candidatus Muiribacteriota bacterium]